MSTGDFTIRHNSRFDLGLDLTTFDMFSDGTAVASGLPLRESAFDVPARLHFSIGTCILECFESRWTLGDITVSKAD